MSTNQEAPISVNIKAYYKGFGLQITKRDPEEKASPLLKQAMETIDWMVEHDFKPSWNEDTNKSQEQGSSPAKVLTSVKKECATCGAEAVERKGVSKSGKPYHGIFCSTQNGTHTEWL